MSTPAGRANLDRSMASAVAWNAAAKWTGQILSWASAIVVARLLTPYDYGIVGMAGVFVQLANIAGQAGIEGAIIATPAVSAEQLAGLNVIALAAGVALLGICTLLAPAVATFFSTPALRAVVVVASVMFVINAFQIVPAALLKKALRFKLLAGINSARVAVQVVVTVVLAFLGFRYWSLVFGTLASCLTAAVLVLAWQRCGFALPRWNRTRGLIRYSGHVFLTQLSWYLYDNADFVVAGRMLGTVPLGNYTVAWQVSSAPLEKITNLVTAVTPAFFSAVQRDLAELRRHFLNLSELMSLAVLPASIGIALTAGYLVPVVFGPKWRGAVGALSWLGLLFALRCMVTLLPNLLSAIGEARFVSRVSLLTVLTLPVAFVVASRWGITAIAAAWVLVYPPLTAPLFWKVFRTIQLRPAAYWSAIQPAVTAALAMAAILLAARRFCPFAPHSALGLVYLVVIGVLAYTATLLLFHRRRMVRVLNGIRRLRAGAAPVGPAAAGQGS